MGFDSFLGNSQTVRAIRDMLARGRVPGSLLFSGTEGVGKKTLATMLAQALVCERRGPAGDDFCGECPNCRKAQDLIAAGCEDLARRREMKDAQRRVDGLLYFDVQLIEPITRYILIEQVRQLRETAYTRPFELPRRIMIVDDAQAIHWQAADLLLKVLEEPPESTTLILVCPNRFELRPTIRSRCVSFQFSPVEDCLIERILSKERGFAGAQLALATRVAGGSIAQARIFDSAEYLQQRKPWLDFLEMAGNSRARMPGPREWKSLFDATKVAASGGVEVGLRIGSTILRDLAQAETQTSGVINIDLLPKLEAWSQQLGMAGVGRLAEGLERMHRLQVRNVNQQLSLDALAAELALESLG